MSAVDCYEVRKRREMEKEAEYPKNNCVNVREKNEI
jgi:hypothetical protein